MHSKRIHTLSELTEHRDTWNALACNEPHRQFEWLSNWWRFFGAGNELFVLCVRDERNQVLGYTPWFLDTTSTPIPTIHFMGSGKACSDHLSLLCLPEQATHVANAVADYLVDHSAYWQHIKLIGCDANDAALIDLCNAMSRRGLLTDRRSGMPTMMVELSSSWDEYLMQRSKPSRRKLRQFIRQVESSDFRVQPLSTPAEIEAGWPHFVELHQKRRRQLGTSGCFDEHGFSDFLLFATMELAAKQTAELTLLHFQDKPIAAALCYLSDTTTYYYQSGMDPEAARHYPGQMLLAFAAKRSIERGIPRLDMLRGEQPYKQRWRAEPQETVEIRAASDHWQSRLRQQAWCARASIMDWIKSTGISGEKNSS